MAGLVCFFSAKAFLILAIITAKIVYLGFLASYTNKVAPIIWIFKVSSEPKSFSVFYADSCSSLGSVLILNLGLGSLSIFFIVKY